MNPGVYFIIITSNYTIEDIFEPTDAEAIKRRCTMVYFYNELERHVSINKDVLVKKQSEIDKFSSIILLIIAFVF